MKRTRLRRKGARAKREEDALDWFRFVVKARDNYTCQRCRQDGWIAHHMKLRNLAFKKEKHCPSIGVCLCWECHTAIHGHHATDWKEWFL